MTTNRITTNIEHIITDQDGRLILNDEQAREICIDYIYRIYRKVAPEEVDAYSTKQWLYTDDDINEVSDSVVDALIHSEIVWELVEENLWIDIIRDKDEELSNKTKELIRKEHNYG